MGSQTYKSPFGISAPDQAKVNGSAAPLRKGDRVVLVAEARTWFTDIGSRVGVVIDLDGWPICEFPGIAERMRIKPEYLEVISDGRR